MLSFKQSISPIRLIFLIAVIALAALSVFSYKSNIRLINESALVNHTNLVKFELQNLNKEIKDAESGCRGYYLTGIKEYLGPYDQSLKDEPLSLIRLDSMVADNPEQVKNMIRLKKLSADKFTFLNTFIGDSSTQNKKNAIAVLIDSRQDMEEINGQIKIMMHEEDRLLRLRTDDLNESVSFTPTINIWLAAFAVLLLVFSYFKIIRELEKSNALQKKLVDANLILEKSNKELAQFAYVASHDLQEPLRKIQTFISRIDETEQNLSPRGKDYFDRVSSSAKRMQQLIRDILAYSRTDNRDNKYEYTNLNTLLADVKDQLDEFIKEKHAAINAGTLPSVNAVKYQLEQVFINLISNALKFAKQDRPLVINISCEKVNGSAIQNMAANNAIDYYRINIADNGIGFAPQYAERIFKIFNRLNTKEEYDGNGIGLSIVKKITESHGGFVTAAGEAERGAVFSIYLPV